MSFDFDDDLDLDDDFSDDFDVDVDIDRLKQQQQFKAQVDKKIRVLLSTKASASDRQEAAFWLGEAGEPKAITALRRAYQNDKDGGVRKASAYSLGMFKALSNALDDGGEKEEQALLLLDSIIHKKAFGRRARFARGTLVRLMGLLTVSFVILLGAGVLISSGALEGLSQPAATPTETSIPPTNTPIPPADPVAVLAELRQMHADLINDSNQLLSQYQLITRDAPYDCDAPFVRPAVYELPLGLDAEAYPVMVETINLLNNARNSLDDLRFRFDQSCEAGALIVGETANQEWDLLTPIQADLQTKIQPLLDSSTIIPGESIPTLTPAPTETPQPTPTLEPEVIAQHARVIQFNLDEMNAPIRGYNNVIIQYWNDIIQGGVTDACRDDQPTLPLDYTITDDERANLPTDLVEAIDSYNVGMALARDAWTRFAEGCASNTLTDIASPGLALAQTAQTAFDESQSKLDSMNDDE